MSVIFRECKSRVRCPNKRTPPSMDDEVRHLASPSSLVHPHPQLKSVHFVLNELFREHRLFEDRFDKLEERVRFDERRTPTATFVSQCQRWIADEQVYLLERIEKLEDENHRLHANYQLEHDRCLETLTDRMLQTLLDRQVSSFSRSDALTDGWADVSVLFSHLEGCKDKCFTRLIALTDECYVRQFFDEGEPNTSRLSPSLSLSSVRSRFSNNKCVLFFSLSFSPGLLA